MLQAHQYSDFHRLIWVCGIIATVGGAGGVFYGCLKVATLIYKRACEMYANIASIKDMKHTSSDVAKTVAETKLAVDLIQTNHLAHLQDGIIEVARTNTQLVEIAERQEKVSSDIRDGIIKLVDRSDRRRSTDNAS
jgi:hypothetical protein